MTDRTETPTDPFNCPKCGAHDYGLFASAMVGCPHCLREELTAAQALAERHANTLADINDGLRAILNDNIEGMERERIEEIADNWKDMIARAERAQALAEQYRKALEEFGMHKDNCAKNLDPFFEISCDCGLDAAIDRAREGEK